MIFFFERCNVLNVYILWERKNLKFYEVFDFFQFLVVRICLDNIFFYKEEIYYVIKIVSI